MNLFHNNNNNNNKFLSFNLANFNNQEKCRNNNYLILNNR